MHRAGPGPALAGFILAGGKSRRMGTDKSLLPFNSSTLIEHIADELRLVAGVVLIVGPPEKFTELLLPAVADTYPDSGPLGGIVTALEHSRSEWNLVVACDLPKVTRAEMTTIVEAARESQADCVVPVSGDGRLQPLCAAYRLSALGLLKAHLEAGRLTLADAILDIRCETVQLAGEEWSANINTPEDWANHGQ
jgi:molybdopterin-guanine dinucleotide biosynthesis protein A